MLHAVIIVSLLAARGCHAAANSRAASVKVTTSKPAAAPSSQQPSPPSRLPEQSSRPPETSSRPPEPSIRPPAPVAALVLAARRSPSDLVDSLRRQLMRDNYDYQNTNTDDDRRKKRQKVGSKTHSYVPRTANEQVSSNALKSNTHKAHNTHQTRSARKAKDKRKTAFRHNPIASDRAPEWHNPYDATYSRDTRVALGPSYSPDRGETLYPHKRHGEYARDEPDSRRGPVVRAAADRDANASDEDADAPSAVIQHPYELPSKSVEAQDSRSIQELTATFGDQKSFGSYINGVKPEKSRQRPVQRSQHIDHPIAKKDLLYYVDDVHLRRNNDVSAELADSFSDAEEAQYGHSHARHHVTGRSRRASANTGPDKDPGASSPPNPEKLVRTSVAMPSLSANVVHFAAVTEQETPSDASVVSLTDSSSDEILAASGVPDSAAAGAVAVTVAGTNATYKLLRVRSRHGGRRAGGRARRLLEERGAAGVALIRLDAAPFPQFRLPRARRQYMRVCVAMFLCVVLLALAGGALAAITPGPMLRISTVKDNMKLSNNSVQFVQAIREDLRRNNDDYVAPDLRERQQRLSRSKSKLPKHVPPQHLDTRRALNANTTATANLTTAANGTLFRSNSKNPDSFKKLRIDKLKRLIDKGKSRLRELMEPGASSTGIGLAKAEPGTTRRPLLSVKLGGLPAMSSEDEGKGRVPLRRPRGFTRSSPSPDQIDMAPARGVHVHMLRLQGRLCQRHMLNPEGPMYDHHGTSIMPAHAPEIAHGREFHQTRAPNIVLPRCCNCCKKSVLGCQ